MNRNTGLLAGEGGLPIEIASRLSEKGCPPVAFAFRDETCDLEKVASEVVRISKPALGELMEEMKKRGIDAVILAGLVSKTLMYRQDLIDGALRSVLSSLPKRDDHSLLGAIVGFFEANGVRVLPYREIIPELMAPEGVIAGRAPLPGEVEDIAYGAAIASALVPLSFGQTVVVKGRSVVAVEAMEGTDATIRRAGKISEGGVVVKVMRPDQDERFDMPVVGTDTLASMHEAGIECLAVEAGRTVILGGGAFRERAEKWSISVTGIVPAPSS